TSLAARMSLRLGGTRAMWPTSPSVQMAKGLPVCPLMVKASWPVAVSHILTTGSSVTLASGHVLASASSDTTIKVWDMTAGRDLLTLRADTDPVNCVTFSPDGRVLASAGADRLVKLWDARSGKQLSTLKGHAHRILSVAFSLDGTLLASAGGDTNA